MLIQKAVSGCVQAFVYAVTCQIVALSVVRCATFRAGNYIIVLCKLLVANRTFIIFIIRQIISCGPQILTVFLIISFDEI